MRPSAVTGRLRGRPGAAFCAACEVECGGHARGGARTHFRRAALTACRLSASSMFTFIPEAKPLSDQSPKDLGEGVGSQQKQPKNPVHRLPDWRATLPLAQSCPRCGARTRSGRSCQGPAMSNSRCRMHGGKSTGPRTAEGLARIRAARTTHGMRTAEMEQMRKLVRQLRAGAKRLVEMT
jgi:ribosomal protein L32